MADISKIKLPDGVTYNVKDTTKLPTSGGTVTGAISLTGTDFNLKTSGTSSDDSGDIVWYYGNGQEKARLWTNNEYTTAVGLNYRVYKKDGTNLITGTIPLENTNTTYTLSTSGNNVVLTPSSGTANTITVPYATDAGTVNNLTVQTAVPANAKFTDTKVDQVPISPSNTLPILLSGDYSGTTSYNGSTCKTSALVWKEYYSGRDPSGELQIRSSDLSTITKIDYEHIETKTVQATTKIITNRVDCNNMSVKDISDQYTITKSSGKWSATSIVAQRTGNVIQLRVVFNGNGSSVSSGGNAFVGTITGPLPVYTLFSAGYYGSVSLVLQFTSNGAVNIRVCGGSVTLPSTTETYFSLTFITNN